MPPRFIADINVGKLAKWLRIAGYDVLLPRDVDDASLINTALREGRILLTRDTNTMRRRVVADGTVKVILLESEKVGEQLRQALASLGEEAAPELSRCIRCNEPLVPRSKGEVAGQVPPHVFQTQESYMQCPRCGRIYWRGTHWEQMKRRLEELRTTSD